MITKSLVESSPPITRKGTSVKESSFNYFLKYIFKYSNYVFTIMGISSHAQELKRSKIKNEDLLLLILLILEEHSYKIVSESDFQYIIYLLKDKVFSYEFFNIPIKYSYDLLEDIKKSNQGGFIDSTIEIIGDESIPKYYYSLSLLGKARSQNIFDSLSQDIQNKLNEYVDEALSKIKE